MIEIPVLAMLSFVDIKKREIPPLFLIGSAIFLLLPLWKEGGADFFGLAFGVCLIAMSLASRQAFGLADAVILTIFGVRDGLPSAMILFLIGDVLLLFTVLFRFLFLKKRDKELPFLPFLTVAYCLNLAQGFPL